MRQYFGILCAIIGLFILPLGCHDGDVTSVDSHTLGLNPEKVSSNVIYEWQNLFFEIEKDIEGMRPCGSARALAYIHLGAYEIVVPGLSSSHSMAHHLKGFVPARFGFDVKDIHWEAALNAYYTVVFNYFFNDASLQHEMMIAGLADKIDADIRKRTFVDIFYESEEWGRAMAMSIIAYATSDITATEQVFDPLPQSYVPPNGPGKWAIEDGHKVTALYPYWGLTRTFIISENDKTALPPYAFSTDTQSKYYDIHQDVLNAVKSQNQQSIDEAAFWDDYFTGFTFSIASRPFSILNQFVNIRKISLAESVELYCRFGLALNDVTVAVWYSKYLYNQAPPKDFIQKYIDPSFITLVRHPQDGKIYEAAYPSYPSEHAAYAGLLSGVLTQITGDQFPFTDFSHVDSTHLAIPSRFFDNWSVLTQDYAYSRFILGLNSKMDCDEGLRLGFLIGRQSMQLSF